MFQIISLFDFFSKQKTLYHFFIKTKKSIFMKSKKDNHIENLVPDFNIEELEERLEFVGTWIIHTGPDCPAPTPPPPPPPTDSN